MSSLTLRERGNQGDPTAGAEGLVHPRTSVESEEEGGGGRKSEPPIGAWICANAQGAKGWRSGITSRGDMARRRADCVHANTTDSFHTEGA